jgi:hypothetical protein
MAWQKSQSIRTSRKTRARRASWKHEKYEHHASRTIAKNEEQEEHHGFGATRFLGNTGKKSITAWNNCTTKKHKHKIDHIFDYFSIKHEQEEQEHH